MERHIHGARVVWCNAEQSWRIAGPLCLWGRCRKATALLRHSEWKARLTCLSVPGKVAEQMADPAQEIAADASALAAMKMLGDGLNACLDPPLGRKLRWMFQRAPALGRRLACVLEGLPSGAVATGRRARCFAWRGNCRATLERVAVFRAATKAYRARAGERGRSRNGGASHGEWGQKKYSAK